MFGAVDLAPRCGVCWLASRHWASQCLRGAGTGLQAKQASEHGLNNIRKHSYCCATSRSALHDARGRTTERVTRRGRS
eukprot:363403-Chlamydomonas_euryale.AAC.26